MSSLDVLPRPGVRQGCGVSILRRWQPAVLGQLETGAPWHGEILSGQISLYLGRSQTRERSLRSVQGIRDAGGSTWYTLPPIPRHTCPTGGAADGMLGGLLGWVVWLLAAPVLGALPIGVYDQLITTTAARHGFDPAFVEDGHQV